MKSRNPNLEQKARMNKKIPKKQKKNKKKNKKKYGKNSWTRVIQKIQETNLE